MPLPQNGSLEWLDYLGGLRAAVAKNRTMWPKLD